MLDEIENGSTCDVLKETKQITLVTGIWDLGRGSLSEGWSRKFDHYINKFEELLRNTNHINLIIFIDKEHEDIVWKNRSKTNTVIYYHEKEKFNSSFFPFFDNVQTIRTNPDWYNQTGWLKDSTQARMEWYNPMVMSKMFMLHNAKCFNPFGSKYFFWIDGGITNTVHPGYFSSDNVLSKLPSIVDKFLFICFPYNTDSEIHGFSIDGMRNFSKSKNVDRVARGGFFGGHIGCISKANELYYSLLNSTLSSGYMGTEESIFTIMTYLDPKTFKYETINENGLINTFFEKLKNNSTELHTKKKTTIHTNNDVELYINTYNSPEQLKMVLESFHKYDNNFLNKTKKILINNSTDPQYFPEYNDICEQYEFANIQQGNMGICGARQFAAENFYNNKSKYMLFFEDDMLLDFNGNCSFGFTKNTKNLFINLIEIMNEEEYDFLKLSFSEFYGHNGQQWSWHNVPHSKKIEYFGDIGDKPLTLFNNIKTLNGLVYADGEIYYSNWPHIIGQDGNKKMFLDTKWNFPFEQTWMSHFYTLTREKTLKPAILLASPITHNRVHFYKANERKEN